MENRASPTTRRRLLAGIAAVASTSAAGCTERMAAAVDHNEPEQVQIEIKTSPTDEDPIAIRIARHLAENLRTAGIDAQVQPTEETKLLRDVLFNGEYDCYVGRHPGFSDPDVLRELLHSQYVEEPGWQNPFSYSNIRIDELLEDQQRVDGSDRSAVLDDVQHEILAEQPFTTVAVPDEIRAVREGAFQQPLPRLATWQNLLQLDPVDRDTVRLGTTDARATRNMNPIAVEFRGRGTITGLVYESLGIKTDDGIVPWLAADWEWMGTDMLRVELRPDLAWHDGTELTAEDVAFTYQFLHDTTLGADDGPLPAPRFRGETSLVDAAEAIDDRELWLEFDDITQSLAYRALTIPILPAHIWREQTETASIAGLDVSHVTEALVWENPDPVGSGPFEVRAFENQSHVVYDRFDEHFLNRDDGEAAHGIEKPTYDELRVEVVPSGGAAVELLSSANLDATVSALPPSIVREIGQQPDVRMHVEQSNRFYHVGYNTARAPLDNPRFRRALARMIDRESLVTDAFERFASATVTPLGGTEYTAPDLQWDGECPELPFAGHDGSVSETVARNVFESAGYRYDESGQLVRERGSS